VKEGPLRSLFVVQGEGRGHLTEAIALADVWRAAGHEVSGLFVGGEGGRPLPAYFAHRIGLDPVRFMSPITRTGAARRGVSIARSLAFNAARFPRFGRSVTQLREAAAELRPDLIVNFYDSVAGRAFSGRRGGPPLVSIGHHYLLGHPEAAPNPRRRILGAPFPLMNRLSAPAGTKLRAGSRCANSATWDRSRA
jgi:UDP:flavonoid glycosyltransferase YjiC (YdhE family)